MIVGFIFLRLRGVLGKRTGFEGKTTPQFQEILKNIDPEVNINQKDIFDKEDIFNRAKKMSPYFQDGLHSLKDLKEIVSIRGYGMMGGIEMKMKDKPGKSGFQTFKHCYDAGVNFKNTGDTLIIAPQFICEKKHIDEIIEKLRTGISNYSKS